jgi:serine/threonine-protein kinase
MTTDHWKQVEALFNAAVELPPAQRETLLQDSCDDESLREEVRSLLRTEAAPDERLALHAAPQAAELIDDYKSTLFPPKTIGDYRIDRQIGLGGMGVVYRASHPQVGTVAVKVLRRGLTAENGPAHHAVIERFDRERNVLARLDHPFIARLLDGGTTMDGQPYLVMEYVRGQTIAQYCDAHALRIDERLQLFRKVCAAVQFAHQNLIVHRDLKPANVLVDEEGTPKLLDFGIATLLNRQTAHAMTTLRAMTVEYASPEQIRNEPVTTATDIYSLGVILFELLSGHHPYDSTNSTQYELERAVCENDPPRPSQTLMQVREATTADGTTTHITPEIVSQARRGSPERLRRKLSGDLDTIVMMSMRKEAARRYESAQQFGDDIRRYLEGMPVSARPDTGWYRAHKFVARNRIPVAISILIVVGLTIGIFAVSGQARRARIAEGRALAMADAESLARQRADVEAQKAARIVLFLQEILAAADPRNDGKNARVMDVLRGATARLEDEFASNPVLASALHDTIGNIYLSLGNHGQARHHLEQALRLRESNLAPVDAEVADSQHHLARLLLAEGHTSEAEVLHRKALATYTAILGPDHPTTAACMANLGLLLQQMGNFAEAESAQRQALEVLRQHGQQIDVAASLANLLVTMARVNGVDDAMPRKLEDLIREVEGIAPHHPLVAQLQTTLAGAYAEQGRLVEAAEVQHQAISFIQHHLDPHHASMVPALNNLGAILSDLGDYAGAEDAHRRNMVISRHLYGDDHPDVAKRMMGLAMTLAKTGQFTESEEMSSDAIAILRKLAPPISLAAGLAVRGWILAESDRLDNAQMAYREGLRSARKHPSPPATLIASLECGLGTVLSIQGDLDAAATLLHRSVAALKATSGPSHPRMARTLTDLGVHYLRSGRLQDAEETLLRARTIQEQSMPLQHPDVGRSLLARGRVAMQRGELSTAEDLFHQAIACVEASPASNHWRLGLIHSALGQSLLELGRYDESESTLQTALNILTTVHGSDHRHTQDCRVILKRLSERLEERDTSATLGPATHP